MKSRVLLKIVSMVDSRLFWSAVRPCCHLVSVFSSGARWIIFAGYANERLGKIEKARGCYQKAAEICAASSRILVLRWLHVAQFLLERAHHDLGSPRVEDPLFGCAMKGLGNDPKKTVGYYKADFVLMGMKLIGILPASSASFVEIRINGTVLRRVNVDRARGIPLFNFLLKRSAIELFPKKSILTISTDQGEPLAAFGGAVELELSIPHGNGSIEGILKSGGKLGKKGAITLSEQETRAHQDAYLRLYAMARDIFDQRIGKQLFLMYGTLLGFYREGDFIKGDDDFDAGYVSDETTPEAVLEETKRIVMELLRAGFTVAFNSRGRLFRIQRDDFGDASIHLDARPIWFQDGRVWAHNHFSALSAREDFLPAKEGVLRGTKIYRPGDTEKFLLSHYGKGWKVPDPGFAYYLSQIDPMILKNLSRALLKPDAYREMSRLVEAERARNPAMGRFISLAAMDLYPLSAFELDAD